MEGQNNGVVNLQVKPAACHRRPKETLLSFYKNLHPGMFTFMMFLSLNTFLISTIIEILTSISYAQDYEMLTRSGGLSDKVCCTDISAKLFNKLILVQFERISIIRISSVC